MKRQTDPYDKAMKKQTKEWNKKYIFKQICPILAVRMSMDVMKRADRRYYLLS